MTIANITTQFLEISKRIYLQKKKKKKQFHINGFNLFIYQQIFNLFTTFLMV